jgi:hypothetical protein
MVVAWTTPNVTPSVTRLSPNWTRSSRRSLQEHPDLLRELLEAWPQPLTPAQRKALGDVVTVH